MKLAVASLLAGSALAFAPAQQGARVATTLNAEKSKSLPFMNRPALVSSKVFSSHLGSMLRRYLHW